MSADIPTTLEPLGFDIDGHIVFRWNLPDGTTTDEVTLTESELGALMREFREDTLPLWPLESCTFCDRDSVQRIYGDPMCHPHAMAYAEREESHG